MAGAAREMTAGDLHVRLPMAETHDELEELARAFNGLLSRLEESFERQRRFTGDASHQLRTPVTAMLGQLDVALTRERSPEEYRRTLEAIQSQSQRLRQIVDSQLFLARADAESFRPQLERLDLTSWLLEHLEAWRENARWPDFQFDFSADRPAIVRAHSQLLAQLFDNLLDNAVKYSPAGTPIRIALAINDNVVECSVTNRGAAISPEDLPNLFEPFFRSADARRRGIAGAGLGLAIAQRIADAMGGLIRADSGQNADIRFVLHLPRNLVAESHGSADRGSSTSLASVTTA
jgi:signal transduction histidine kinase